MVVIDLNGSFLEQIESRKHFLEDLLKGLDNHSFKIHCEGYLQALEDVLQLFDFVRQGIISLETSKE